MRNTLNRPYDTYSHSPPRANARLPKKKRHLIRNLFQLVLLVVAAVFAFKLFIAPSHSKAHSSDTPAVVKPEAIDGTALGSQLNQLINQSSLEVGVSITDLSTNTNYDYGLHSTGYVAASTTKLVSAALYLHDVEQGQASLNDPMGDSTASDELKQMIVVSDNDAWVDFNDYLGHPALLQYAQSLSISDYNPDDNTITADSLALLLTKLYQGKLLNSSHTQLLLSYMSQADYTQYIEAAVPSGVKFYHKAGYLDDRAMDAAIIDNGKHSYVLVIFTKDPSGAYDQDAGQQAFHSITTATLSAFAN